MNTLKSIVFPLLMALALSNCNSPVDEETQAKSRKIALAKAVRQTDQQNNANEDNDAQEAEADEPMVREVNTKDE